MKNLIIATIVFSISLYASGYEDKYKNNNSYNELYVKECGSCHIAFQAEFLPKRSWNKMMDTLENHFGVDATFDANDEKQIREYLLSNASDSKRGNGEMSEFGQSVGRQHTPLAISETPKFRREHRKITKRLITQKEVKSISNCLACHKDANEGLYSERNILIPNYGRWDD